jgi:hypothetical protein
LRINLGYLPNTNCWELLVTTMVQTKSIAQSTKGPFENSEKQILLPFRHLYQVVRQVITPLFPLGWDSPSFSITIFSSSKLFNLKMPITGWNSRVLMLVNLDFGYLNRSTASNKQTVNKILKIFVHLKEWM